MFEWLVKIKTAMVIGTQCDCNEVLYTASNIGEWGKYVYFTIGFWTSATTLFLSCLWFIFGFSYFLWLYVEDRKPFLKMPHAIAAIFDMVDSENERVIEGGWVWGMFGLGLLATLVFYFMWFILPGFITVLGLVYSVHGIRGLRRRAKSKERGLFQRVHDFLRRRPAPPSDGVRAGVDAKFQKMFLKRAH